ncbi:MAG: hypothetical protein H6R13_2752 [Proteobacteria bacterium]|nr:hypothetical protein [Pseudomonadota bacterium]
MALLLLLLLGLGVGTAIFLSAWNSSNSRLAQEHKTQETLVQAKEALIAYAASVYPAGNVRPGDLPCPDTNNDGKKESSCGNANGSTGQAVRLGRLPWKSLGLADLRDASGERLWYAVSNNFKENTRHLPLNSDTTGTIQVADSSGNIIPDVIAVIIAPGPPLQRLNDAAIQDRSPAVENNPANYLDETATEDNADFTDSGTNGFVGGIVRDAQGRILVNDSMILITYTDLMPLLEKQVASTVLNCLNTYAAYIGGIHNNQGRYPWAADIAASALNNYTDSPNTLFGRIPDTLINSKASSANMLPDWSGIPSCTINENWFRNNWRELVFYAIADAFKPGTTPAACGTCLTVGSTPNIRVAVLLGRQALTAPPLNQNHASKAIIGNYLEGGNATPYDGLFETNPISTTFNDLLVFK